MTLPTLEEEYLRGLIKLAEIPNGKRYTATAFADHSICIEVEPDYDPETMLLTAPIHTFGGGSADRYAAAIIEWRAKGKVSDA